MSTAPVTVVVPAFGSHGSPYAAFVGRWWAAVAAMEPRPAEVVVVHSAGDPLGMLATAPPGIAAVPVEAEGARGDDYTRAGIAAASQPWVCCVGVDDVLQADAFADLAEADAAGADVLVWCHHDGETIRRNRWTGRGLRENNTVHGSSPFRRATYDAVGGLPAVAWSDWGLWLRFAAAGATPHHVDRVGVLWDQGGDRETFTRQAADPAVLAARNTEIASLARSLFRPRIAVYALCRNEAHHVAAWEESCRDADVRVVTDTGSDDGTDRLLRERGVDVRTGAPVPWRWDDAHNLSLMHAPADADICVRLDLDETLAPGWREIVEREFGRDGANNLVYRYVYSRNPDGTPATVFHLDRVHARHGFRWQQATHEGLVCWSGEKRQRFAPGLEINHHRDPGKVHKSDLSLLQVAVAEAPHDARARWYLARELDYAGHPAAAAEFASYLDMPGGTPTERSYALRVLARITQHEEYLHRAAAESPQEPDAWERLALAKHHAGNHAEALTFAEAAIASPLSTHATDCRAKARAHELASIALWQLGRQPEALPHARAAVAGLPGDERLARNLADMEAALADSDRDRRRAG